MPLSNRSEVTLVWAERIEAEADPRLPSNGNSLAIAPAFDRLSNLNKSLYLTLRSG